MRTILVIIFVVLLSALFWHLAGLFADWFTPKILAAFRRRRKKINVNRCPMLECNDKRCVYYDKEHLICRFFDRPELLQEDSSDLLL